MAIDFSAASVTASASGTLSGLTASSVAITWEAPSTQAAPTLGFNGDDTTLAAGGSISGADVQKLVSTTRTSQTLRVTLASQEDATTDFTTFVNINDISGKITGQTSLLWSKIVTIAAGDTYADVSVAATLLNGQQWKATLYTTSTTDVGGTEGATRTATTRPSGAVCGRHFGQRGRGWAGSRSAGAVRSGAKRGALQVVF